MLLRDYTPRRERRRAEKRAKREEWQPYFAWRRIKMRGWSSARAFVPEHVVWFEWIERREVYHNWHPHFSSWWSTEYQHAPAKWDEIEKRIGR